VDALHEISFELNRCDAKHYSRTEYTRFSSRVYMACGPPIRHEISRSAPCTINSCVDGKVVSLWMNERQ